MTDQERALMFRRGFGDGAKGTAYRYHEDLDYRDYMEGYKQGQSECMTALSNYMDEQNLSCEFSILRERKGV